MQEIRIQTDINAQKLELPSNHVCCETMYLQKLIVDTGPKPQTCQILDL